MKNVMSDRHIVQKQFDNVFQHYCASLLPNVVENWEEMNDDIQSNFIKVNDIFCGLHFLIGIADQTEAYQRHGIGYYMMIDQTIHLQMVSIPKVSLVRYG